MSDPFSLVYDALWELVESSPAITNLVRVGNRIKLNRTTPGDLKKDQATTADKPELTLELVAATGNLLATSSTTEITRQYQWGLITGNTNVVELNPLEFNLVAAMVDWPFVLAALEWNSWRFVKRVNIVNADQAVDDLERNRSVRGWSAVWVIEVEMHFRTSDLRAINTGTGS